MIPFSEKQKKKISKDHLMQIFEIILIRNFYKFIKIQSICFIDFINNFWLLTKIRKQKHYLFNFKINIFNLSNNKSINIMR